MQTEPINALKPLRGREYRDGVVTVRPRPAAARRRLGSVRTEHFDLVHDAQELVVEHGFSVAEVDDDLAGLLSAELFDPGWLRGQDLFERIFTGVVLTSGPEDPLAAWTAFYQNTVESFDLAQQASSRVSSARAGDDVVRAESSIARYAPVHTRVAELVCGERVLELGSCFGFLALRLAARGVSVTASDLSAGSMRLLGRVAPQLGVPMQTLVADAAHLPVPDRSYDTVLAIHLLEHLEPDDVAQAVREAVRVARRRVVVAVPFEEEPSEQFGHLHRLGMSDLRHWGAVGAASGWSWEVFEHHGGWLVLDA